LDTLSLHDALPIFPLTSGFVGEFMLLSGLFRYNVWISAFAGTTVIFSAVYMLRMYQTVILGATSADLPAEQKRLSVNEMIALISLIIVILWIGCFPNFILDLAGPAVKTILNYIP
jgi:NADH-quinone oxidoreductase subunit M